MLINRQFDHKEHLVFASILVAWTAYAILYSLSFHGIIFANLSDYIIAIVLVGLNISAAILSISLVRKATQPQARKVYLLFTAAWLMAIISDCFYSYYQIMGSEFNNLRDSSCAIPFMFFILFYTFAWVKIFVNFSEQKEKKSKINYLPLVLIASLIYVAFLFGQTWKIQYLSLSGMYNNVGLVFDLMGFVVATFCLARTKTAGIKYTAVGYLVIVAADLIMRVNDIQNDNALHVYIDNGWILGLMLLNYGLFSHRADVNQEHRCLVSVNSVQTQLALWGFSLAILSVFVFFSIDLIFTFNNQALIDHLPSIIIIISIVAIFVSVYLSQKILAPMYKLETDINGYLASNKPFKPDESDITEFRKLHRFVQQSFTLQDKHWKEEKEYADYIKRVIHDLRSPLSAINTVAQDLRNELQTDKYELLQSTLNQLNTLVNMTLAKAKAERGQEEDKFLASTIVEE